MACSVAWGAYILGTFGYESGDWDYAFMLWGAGSLLTLVGWFVAKWVLEGFRGE